MPTRSSSAPLPTLAIREASYAIEQQAPDFRLGWDETAEVALRAALPHLIDDAALDRGARVLHTMFCAPGCPHVNMQGWAENVREIMRAALLDERRRLPRA